MRQKAAGEQNVLNWFGRVLLKLNEYMDGSAWWIFFSFMSGAIDKNAEPRL